MFQSNSWGGALTTGYTTISAAMDDIVFDHDLLICQSQSNAGTRSSRPQAWAKNVVSVGGQYHRNTLSRADDAWSSSASIGPAADGRLKPDLSNYYDQINTTSSTSDTSYTATLRRYQRRDPDHVRQLRSAVPDVGRRRLRRRARAWAATCSRPVRTRPPRRR